ncbi:hypothetical protein GF314_03190 [bacterium]|nr:hypothetical protein [bacterium]
MITISRTMLALVIVGAALGLGTAPALADLVIDLPGLTGDAPPVLQQEITFPADMSGVVAIHVRMTYTNWPGTWICEGETEPEEALYIPFVSMVWIENGGITSLLAMFDPDLDVGEPVTDTLPMEFHGAPPYTFERLAGRTIEVAAGIVTEQAGCELIDDPMAHLEDVQMILIGDIVATEPTSFSSIKGLFR